MKKPEFKPFSEKEIGREISKCRKFSFQKTGFMDIEIGEIYQRSFEGTQYDGPIVRVYNVSFTVVHASQQITLGMLAFIEEMRAKHSTFDLEVDPDE